MTDADDHGLTCDAVLGGRLRLWQPARGHRAGHDAILLAAAVAAACGQHVVDLGAGVGTAGLAVARRVAGVRMTLAEKAPTLAELAARNIAENGIDGRAVTLDIAARARDFAAAGLPPQCADWAIANPPFNAPDRHQPSPFAGRRLAHVTQDFAVWVKAALRMLRTDGRFVVIYRADALDFVLSALSRLGGIAGSGRFGAVTVLPVYGKPGAPAIRVIVGGIKGSRAPLSLLPGLTLTGPEGRNTPEAEAILRDAHPLPLLPKS